MKLKKKTLFKIHSWIGIRLSILFFIVCFSGTLATLSHEMDWLFNPAIRASPHEQLASRNLVMDNFRKIYPEAEMTFWMRTDEPYLCDILYKMESGRRSYVFANPYTGDIQGEAQITFQRFFRDLHYFLFIPFQIGHFTVLTFGFLLLISLITALVFYKKWWRKLFELQIGKGPLVFFRSLHRLVGLWSVPFALLFSITGIWYFLERANIGNIGKLSNPKAPKVKGYDQDEMILDLNTLDYDKVIAIAEKQIPNFQVGDLVPNRTVSSSIYMTGKSDVPLVRQRANRVYLDPSSYEVLQVQKATELSPVMLLNDIADPLHFGSWGGLTTKIIWFIFGLGISSLVLTGIWIAVKRKAVKRKRQQQKVMGAWRFLNWSICMVMVFFMYYIIIDRYKASTIALLTISFGWSLFLFVAYYLFVFRMNKIVERSKD